MFREQKKRTKIIDIKEYTLKQTWKRAGHLARIKYSAAQKGIQGKGRDQGNDQAEDGMTL